MPFIIATSYRQLSLDAVLAVDAGEDIITVCDPGATLEAAVIGDLVGRAIIWEQVAGTPVTFTTPLNQLTVSYTTTTFDDKRFRFTVDKNLPTERFDEVDVFGAPTFKAIVAATPSSIRTQRAYPGATAFGSSTPNIKVVGAFLGDYSEATVVDCDSFNTPMLLWPHVSSTAKHIGYEIQYRQAAGPWTTEAVVSSTTNAYLINVANATYRVGALYQTANGPFTAFSNTVFYTPALDGEVFVSDAVNITGSPSSTKAQAITTFDTALLVLVKKPPNTDDAPVAATHGSARTNAILTFDVETLSLTAKPPQTDAAVASLAANAKTDVLVSFTVIDLTGGSIGG